MTLSVDLTKQISMNVLADFVAKRNDLPDRRKCFISYHVADQEEVQAFVEKFGRDFIFTCLGVVDEDNFVNSDDDETIKRVIREKHLTNTSVTIVLIGKCTWARKFIDWEISSSLRNDSVNKRSGVVAIPLPSLNNSWKLPQRLKDNYNANDEDASYVVGKPYPASILQLRTYVEQAIYNRDKRSHLTDNKRPLMKSNFVC